jgi:predicted RNA-binding Zn-ribbon protein involved in translation (DUF1610 family)
LIAKRRIDSKIDLVKFDSQKIIQYLNTKWAVKPCPMCGIIKWNVSDKLFELREYHGGDLVIGGQASIIPLIPIICSNCGNTIFINAIVAGVEIPGIPPPAK